MEELSKEQLDAGKKVLGGVTIFFWVVAALIAVGLFSFNNFGNWAKDFTIGPVSFGLPTSNSTWIVLALYVAALVGLYIRKGWAVPVGRAGLVVAMVIFFPVGTIFGAILWKRFNDPVAKSYLNYGAGHEVKAEGNGQQPGQPENTQAITEVKDKGNTEDKK